MWGCHVCCKVERQLYSRWMFKPWKGKWLPPFPFTKSIKRTMDILKYTSIYGTKYYFGIAVPATLIIKEQQCCCTCIDPKNTFLKSWTLKLDIQVYSDLVFNNKLNLKNYFKYFYLGKKVTKLKLHKICK